MNHAISVVECWIFDSNYERALVINRESLDIICVPYVGEEQVAKLCCEIHSLNSTTKKGMIFIHNSFNQLIHYTTRIKINIDT